MEPTDPAKSPIRFGTFEVDPRSGELRKAGRRVRLQDQPFRVLLLLLEHPGEVVAREELQRRIWPKESFGDFEHGVNVAIAKIRAALGDSAESPRFIETLPRRGYRFIYPVEVPAKSEVSEPQGANAEPRVRTVATGAPEAAGAKNVRRRARVWGAMALLTATAIAAGSVWRSGSRKLTEKDQIVVADFVNSTGDAVFDGTLRRGLEVELEQSPFLSVVPEKEIEQTLAMMKQPADARLTRATAREVCQRVRSAALLQGAIAQIGSQYNVTLKAEGCAGGETVASSEAVARDRNHVLEALGEASSRMRKKLGESLATVEKFNTPLQQATTSSLEALQAYDAGYKVADQGNYAEALPLFQRATELDSNFAMAYTLLGMMHWNLARPDEALKNLQRGYDLRATGSQRERIFIEFEYYSVKDQSPSDRAQRAIELWERIYPRDCEAWGEGGAYYGAAGDDERALEKYREGYRLCPDDGLMEAGMMAGALRMDRLEEAQSVASAAQAKNSELSFEMREQLYLLDFERNDTEGMQQQVAFAVGKPGFEDRMWYEAANTAAYFGKFKRSRELYRQAVNSAWQADEKDRSLADETVEAIREAVAGNRSTAKQLMAEVLAYPESKDIRYITPLGSALCGDVNRAKTLAEQFRAENPDDYGQFIQLPQMEAMIALDRKEARKAVELLRPSAYEQRFRLSPSAYYRGLAYLANGQGQEAGSEFQKMLEHPGLVENSVEGALAQVQLARAYAMQGESEKARAAYQKFLTLWKDADPEVPILKEARAEYAKLQGK